MGNGMNNGHFHVMPMDDTSDHTTDGLNCKCRPKIAKDCQVIVHNAFDLREALEEISEIKTFVKKKTIWQRLVTLFR